MEPCQLQVIGVNSFERLWDIARQTNNPLHQISLLAHEMPLVGNYIPGPKGDLSGSFGGVMFSRGIYGFGNNVGINDVFFVC